MKVFVVFVFAVVAVQVSRAPP
jgi:hypothetical protein